MENCEPVKNAIATGNCLFGTVDTWLIWVCVCVCVHGCVRACVPACACAYTYYSVYNVLFACWIGVNECLQGKGKNKYVGLTGAHTLDLYHLLVKLEYSLCVVCSYRLQVPPHINYSKCQGTSYIPLVSYGYWLDMTKCICDVYVVRVLCFVTEPHRRYQWRCSCHRCH